MNGKNKRWAEIRWESRQEERLQRMADKKLKQMERQKLTECLRWIYSRKGGRQP